MGDLERDFLRFRDGGSTRAMARVFDQAAPELLLVAGHLARDASAAEDLVQGTLLAAIEQRAQFDASRRLMPWLLGILVNLHRTERRRPEHPAVPESWPACLAAALMPPGRSLAVPLARRPTTMPV